MTDQEINVAIAEACGWKPCEGWWCQKCGKVELYEVTYAEFHENCGTLVGTQPTPDYCHDLNAMHEAERVVFDTPDTIENDARRKFYTRNLNIVSCKTYGDRLFRATAHQRAEAFLRTLGKWNEWDRKKVKEMKKGKTKKAVKVNMCKCGKNPESDWEHTCPYKEEIDGDSETHCRCCDECRHDCEMEI